MRNAKSILILFALVVGAALWNVSLVVGHAPTTAVRHRGLVDPSSDICQIRIVRAEGTPLVLKEASPDVWRIAEPFSGSADRQAVMRLLDAVLQAPVIDLLSDSDLLSLGHARADFALENPSLILELTDDRMRQTVCRFGSSTPTDDGVYVSLDGIDAVFVVKSSLLKAVDVTADDFRRRSLLSATASVSSLSVRKEGGTPLEFVRTESGWTIGGKAAAQSVGDYIVRLTTATATSFVWPVGASNETDRASSSLLASYGLDPETAVSVSLSAADGAGNRILFGKTASDGFVYALIQNGGAIVTVPAELRDFLRQDPVLFADSRIFPGDSRQVPCYMISADGGLYSLSRGPDALWRLDSPVVAIADQEAAEAVLSRILALSPSDVVTEGGVSVTAGTNATKFLVSRQSVLGERAFECLRSREMLKIDPSLVRRIVSTPRKGTPSSVVYDRDLRQWSIENGAANASVSSDGVEKILSVLNPLKAERVEKLNVTTADLDDYGLDAPTLTVAIDQNVDESVRRNVIIGKRAEKGWFATIGSSDAVFVVSDKIVRNLSAAVEKK